MGLEALHPILLVLLTGLGSAKNSRYWALSGSIGDKGRPGFARNIKCRLHAGDNRMFNVEREIRPVLQDGGDVTVGIGVVGISVPAAFIIIAVPHTILKPRVMLGGVPVLRVEHLGFGRLDSLQPADLPFLGSGGPHNRLELDLMNIDLMGWIEMLFL
jgi:hypothetical protein